MSTGRELSENAWLSWAGQTFSPLANPVFRKVWVASSMSNLGSMVQLISAAWLMTTLTSSPFLIAMVQTAAAVPFVIFALFAGASADIFDKRLQMIAGSAICLVAVSLLLVLTMNGEIAPWSLLTLTAIIGIGTTLITPAWQASVIEIVKRHELMSAISINSLSFNLARCIGPAIGAELIVIASVAGAFLSNAVSYIVMILALLTWKRIPLTSDLPRESIVRAIGDGIRFASLSPSIRVLLLRAFLMSFCASSLLAMPPLIASQMEAGPRGLGILLGGFGSGAMVGSFTASWARSKFKLEKLVLINAGMLSISLLLLSISNSIWLSALALVIGGGGWVQSVVAYQLAVQTSCPRWVTGRIISIFTMSFSLGLAGGSALWGSLATILELSITLAISGFSLIITSVTAARLPFEQPDHDDLQPSILIKPDNNPPLNPRLGPISVSVEYRVPSENLAEFRNKIQTLQRIRRRDGARNWTLSQDIDDNELWLERFLCPTWGEYLRRLSRRIAADDPVQMNLWSLCSGRPNWKRHVERLPNSSPIKRQTADESEPSVNDIANSI